MTGQSMTLREKHEDLKEQHEMVMRAIVRLVGAYDPGAPEELANLVYDLALAAGIGSQNEAQAILRGWQQPIHTSSSERLPQVTSSWVRVR